MVFQEVYLSNISIEENTRIGCPTASNMELVEATK